MSEILYPRFIENSPCGEDLLSSGSQGRVAASIVKHLQNKSTGQKLIGLDGSWGSGKSNLISIIKKSLRDTHYVFVYDSWSHQEDLQRRSFLEELTRDLTEEKLLNLGKWEDKLKSLLAKRKETITKTIPKISPAYYFVFLSLLLLPVTKQISEFVCDTAVFWKLFVSMSPIIFLLISWLVAAFLHPEYRKLNKLFAIYNERDLQKTVDEVISEREPSLHEFRKWMEGLSDDLKKEIIIVFDNMDRLTPDKVLKIWSSIHTFFSEKTYPKIWLIVPFDRIHLINAFNKEKEQTNHFINKTFSVIFSVSPVVLTDWWEFFEKKFAEAFGQTEEKEMLMVKSLYDRYRLTITPRDIIAFINDLVALKLVWKDDISLRYMALFNLNKDDILSDPVTKILEKNYLAKSSVLFKDDVEVMDNMAALVYSVPLAKASQVTLSRSIITSIREGNFTRLKELAAHPDFYKILEEIFSKEDLDIEPATHALQEIESFAGENNSTLMESAWDVIVDKQTHIAIDTQIFTDVFKGLLSHASAFRIRPLAQHIIKQWSISREFSGKNYFLAINPLCDFVRVLPAAIESNEIDTILELDSNHFVSYLREAGEQYNKYSVSCSNTVLDDFYVSKFNEDWNSFDKIECLADAYKFPKLEKVIITFIDSSINSQNLVDVFKIYKSISSTIPLVKKLADQTIVSLMANAQPGTEVYYELVAMRLGRTDEFSISGGVTQNVLNLVDEKTIQEVSKRVEIYTNYGDLLEKSVDWPQPLLKQVAKYLTLHDLENTRRLNISEIMPRFYEITTAIDVSEEILFNKLSGWSNNFEKKLNAKTIESMIPNLDIVEFAKKSKERLAVVILDAAKNFLETTSADEWTVNFADESSYGFKMLVLALNLEIISETPQKCINSYKARLETLASSTNELPTLDITDWKNIYEKSDQSKYINTAKNIRDIFLSKANITPAKFIFFDPLLNMEGILDDRFGDYLRLVLTNMVANLDSLNCIMAHENYYLPKIANCDAEKYDFIKAIYAKREENPENTRIGEFEQKLNELIFHEIEIQNARFVKDKKETKVAKELSEIIKERKSLHFKINDVLSAFGFSEEDNPVLEVEFTFKSKVRNMKFGLTDWLNLL